MDEVYVERLTIRPTLRCNFRCKYCNEFSPYYDNPITPDCDTLIRSIDRTFDLVDRVRILEISGGEPLLYKPLSKIIEYLVKYNERYEFFSFVTNGSIKFNNEIIAAFKQLGIKLRVIVDDYGSKLSKHAKENADILKAEGIRHELRDQFDNIHSGGWFDFTDFSLKHTEQEAKELFSRCVVPQKLHFVVTLHDGKLYPCHFLRRAAETGIIPSTAVEIIDVFSDTLTDQELRSRIKNLYTLDVLSSCRYCAGFVEGRERLRPAEQLPKGE